MKNFKHLTLAEDTSLKEGSVIAVEGIGDFIGKIFGGTAKKALTPQQYDALMKTDSAGFPAQLQTVLEKSLLNPTWVGKNLKLGEKNAYPSKIAFINGKNEPNPEKLVAVLQEMFAAAQHTLKVLDPNIKLRQQLCKQMMSLNGNIEKADALYEQYKSKLVENPAEYYLAHGGKNIKEAVGQNPAAKVLGFPVLEIGDGYHVFESYYASSHVPQDCALIGPTNQTAKQYAELILKVMTIWRGAEAALKTSNVPYWDASDLDYNELRYGDEIFAHIFVGQHDVPNDAMASVSYISYGLLSEMLKAI